MTAIPTIDMGSEDAAVADAIGAACREVGFFQIIGHGVPVPVIERARRAALAFFDLPLADRMAAARRTPDDAYGYIAIETEALTRSMVTDEASAADLKATFNAGPFDRPTTPVDDAGERWAFAPTPWPPALPELRDALEPYAFEMLQLAARLMRLFAIALRLPDDHFDSSIDQSPSALRIIDYPHLDAVALDRAGTRQLRAGAHTDYGTLTLLVQDDAPGGLEVLDPASGQWTPVPARPDAIVVNLGDLLARWTNDRWRSTLHRVVVPPRDAPGSTRRQSIAFFHNANYHAVVQCLPTCLDPGERPRHPPVVAGPHLMTKFHRAVHAD
ncbi:MAG: isopenicillin synthase family oxygenase [Ilumatobacteraceae bacterium]|nr:isopenicillin synthase family oxygenase [Ilumatobacteraceae bacterium]